MKLRDHPAMVRKSGYCSWPPRWTTPNPDRDEKPTGEVGTLEDVAMSKLIDNKLFLFMLYRGYRYMGVMAFDDLTFCQMLHDILKLNRGLPIKQVGDLDLSHTL